MLLHQLQLTTATDNCTGSIIATTSDPLSYNEQGNYIINWQYIDGNGNTATQTQAVLIEDSISPEIVTQDIMVDLAGQNAVSITPEQLINSANDNCSMVALSIDQNTFTQTGNYEVVVTATDLTGNTIAAVATVTVTDSVAGINDITKTDIAVYPVPAKESVNISVPQNMQIGKINMYDTNMRLIKTYDGETRKIDVSDVVNGVYYLMLNSEKGISKHVIIK